MIYPHIFPEEEEDSISSFMIKLNDRSKFLFKDIMEEYNDVNKTVYGTGLSFSCEVDGIDKGRTYELGIPFTGSCEFEIDKVTCWLGEKYSNLFEVEVIAKDVNVRKLVWVKSKYEMEGN